MGIQLVCLDMDFFKLAYYNCVLPFSIFHLTKCSENEMMLQQKLLFANRVRVTVPVIYQFSSHINTILLIKKNLSLSWVQDHVSDITEDKKMKQRQPYSQVNTLSNKMEKSMETKGLIRSSHVY